MKKIAPTLAFLSSLAFSQQIQVTNDWQLLAATEDITISNLNNTCIDSLWLYDKDSYKPWKLYMNDLTSSYSSNKIELLNDGIITKGSGFWIKGKYPCKVDTTVSVPKPEFESPVLANSISFVNELDFTSLKTHSSDIKKIQVNDENIFILYPPEKQYNEAMTNTLISDASRGIDVFKVDSSDNITFGKNILENQYIEEFFVYKNYLYTLERFSVFENSGYGYKTWNYYLKKVIYDISDLDNINLVKEVDTYTPYDSELYANSFSPKKYSKVYKNFLFARVFGFLNIYDLTDPLNISLISSMELNGTNIHDGEYWDIDDTKLVIPYHSGGFEVVDISDISNPESYIYSDNEYEELLDFNGMNYYGGVDSVHLNNNKLTLSIELVGKRVLDISDRNNILNTKNEYYFQNSSINEGQMVSYGENILNFGNNQIQLINSNDLSIVDTINSNNQITSIGVNKVKIKNNKVWIVSDSKISIYELK